MADVLTFDAAQHWLARRRTLPTALSSRQLALAPEFPAQVRMQAFFSARVTSANVLEALRVEIGMFAAGGVDIATARTRMKTFLSRHGLAADDVGTALNPPPGMSRQAWLDRRKITNLASSRRLDLILRQNAAMAHALGQRQVSMDPDIVARWPYYRYDARRDARSTHGALDNLVLPKSDPFWLTHTPPWEFNCRCAIFDADAGDAARAGGLSHAAVTENADGSQTGTVALPDGRRLEVPPGESGFVFRVDQAFGAAPDWRLVKNAVLRRRLRADAAVMADGLPRAALTAIAEKREDELVQLKHEKLVAINPFGDEVFSAESAAGDAFSISLTEAQARRLAGMTVTHNHPRGWGFPAADPRRTGNSFSLEDITLAARNDVVEMRAVSPGYRYVMRRPDAGWPATDVLVKNYTQAEADTYSLFSARIERGEMTESQAEAEHYHDVWRRVAANLGLDYRREKK